MNNYGTSVICVQRHRMSAGTFPENQNHVERFFKILEDVEKIILGFYPNGDRVWNMDETVYRMSSETEPKYFVLHKLTTRARKTVQKVDNK